MKGLTHIYYGDGKGKTTAALGLALRAAGHGKKVVIVQFLKGRESGELITLERLGISVCRSTSKKFFNAMTDTEKQLAYKEHTDNLTRALGRNADVLILDELLDAVMLGLVDSKPITDKLSEKDRKTEIIITGHKKIDAIFEYADYITEMKKEKHPFDTGIMSRKGIEY